MHVKDDDDDGDNDHHHRHKKKDIQEEEGAGGGGWLQLSIGSCSSHHLVDQNDQDAITSLEQQVPFPRRRRSRSITCGVIEEEEEDHHHHHHQSLDLGLLSPDQVDQISVRRRSSSTLSPSPPSSQAEPDSSISAVMITNESSPNNLFLQKQYYPRLMGSNYYSNSALPFSFSPSPPHFQDLSLSSISSNNIISNPTNYNKNNNRNISIASSSLMPSSTHVFSSSSYFTNRLSFPTFDFRVIDPPRRPHSGLWFMLQAALIQSKEPFLPQIPKRYLRIKDGRMTVQFIIKYLVDKLRLDNEIEIEIRCRGQQLVPFLTLQHVRDSVWMMSPSSPMDTTQLTSTSDHLMVLHYSRLS